MTQEQPQEPEASTEVPIPAEEQPQHQHEQKHETVADVPPISEEQPQEEQQHKPLTTEEPVESSEEQPLEEQQHKPVTAEEPVKSSDEPSTELNEQTPPDQNGAVTYGDVFPAAVEPLSSEPITIEDASLMQTAEALAFGNTRKGGAASAMQAAAAHNVQSGFVEKDAHSIVSEYGLSVTETSIPGATLDVEYVAGQPVSASAHPTPTDPLIAALEGVTIGEALEAAALGAGDRPVADSDARAIESAERRATGVAAPRKGGIGATAQSAAQLNHGIDKDEQTTLADVLMDATADLPTDKLVTYEDAFRVIHAELRGGSVDDLQPGGVGATLIAAAELNEQAGLFAASDEQKEAFLDRDETEDDDAVGNELRKYQKLDSKPSDLTEESQDEVPPPSALGSEKSSDILADLRKETEATEEEKTPLVNSGEKIPSNHGNEELSAPKQTSEEAPAPKQSDV